MNNQHAEFLLHERQNLVERIAHHRKTNRRYRFVWMAKRRTVQAIKIYNQSMAAQNVKNEK